MVANDYACYLNKPGAFTSFASKLAPTGFAVFRPVFDYNFVIKLLVGCPDRLVNLNSVRPATGYMSHAQAKTRRGACDKTML
ncbi:hypothetical protein EMIT0196MI5_230087 [Pseudomonas sp. IT-196MI5]